MNVCSCENELESSNQNRSGKGLTRGQYSEMFLACIFTSLLL